MAASAAARTPARGRAGTPALVLVRTSAPVPARPATPARATLARPAPARPTPVRAAPARPAPAHLTPVRSTPVRSTPVRSTPVRSTPVRPAPARPGPARPASAPARRPAPGPVRLTRRGRLVAGALIVVAAAAAALLLSLLLGGGALAASHGSPGAGYQGLRQVVVQPGETLWSLAARADPSADPRTVIPQIMSANSLTSSTIYPGEQLWVPR
jgi:hypothetical protein